MGNYKQFSPDQPTNRLDISNIHTVTTLFLDKLQYSKDEWNQWGPTNEAFCPFEALVPSQFEKWVNKNLNGNLPFIPVANSDCPRNFDVRWMPSCSYSMEIPKGASATMFFSPEFITNWHLNLVYLDKEQHRLFLYVQNAQTALGKPFWAEFLSNRLNYPSEERIFVDLLHAWIDW